MVCTRNLFACDGVRANQEAIDFASVRAFSEEALLHLVADRVEVFLDDRFQNLPVEDGNTSC